MSVAHRPRTDRQSGLAVSPPRAAKGRARQSPPVPEREISATSIACALNPRQPAQRFSAVLSTSPLSLLLRDQVHPHFAMESPASMEDLPIFYVGHHETRRSHPVTELLLHQAQDLGVSLLSVFCNHNR